VHSGHTTNTFQKSPQAEHWEHTAQAVTDSNKKHHSLAMYMGQVPTYHEMAGFEPRGPKIPNCLAHSGMFQSCHTAESCPRYQAKLTEL